jgi:AraC-like DNA-binding protein
MYDRPVNGVRDSRTKVLDLPVGFVEDLRRWSPSPEKSPEGFCTDFQICLPYAGFFVWHVGKDDVVGDPNQVMFVRGGEPFQVSTASRFGYAELIVTPEIGILSEIAHVNGRPLSEHPLFTRRAAVATCGVQAAHVRFSHWLPTAASRECLEAEEALIALIRAALESDVRRLETPTAGTARVIRRTKQVLHDRLTERLRLADIARDVGASPAYLTDLFRRTEGIPVHQYLMRLRLARALVELPHADDLTALALDLGFSSHSHFTATFRRQFGRTPSQYRERTRGRARSDAEMPRARTTETFW